MRPLMAARGQGWTCVEQFHQVPVSTVSMISDRQDLVLCDGPVRGFECFRKSPWEVKMRPMTAPARGSCVTRRPKLAVRVSVWTIELLVWEELQATLALAVLRAKRGIFTTS